MRRRPRRHRLAPRASVRCARRRSRLCRPLATDDYALQSMPDASPAKWHIAHTSWFFEEFVLKAALEGLSVLRSLVSLSLQFLLRVRRRRATPARARPAVAADHRAGVGVSRACRRGDAGPCSTQSLLPSSQQVVTVGLHHEQQHQELFLTDIKHLFSRNPLRPAYASACQPPRRAVAATPLAFIEFAGGLVEIGHTGAGFCFDNELARHQRVPRALPARESARDERRISAVHPRRRLRTPRVLALGRLGLRAARTVEASALLGGIARQEFTLAGDARARSERARVSPELLRSGRVRALGRRRLPTEFEWEMRGRRATVFRAISSKTANGIRRRPHAQRPGDNAAAADVRRRVGVDRVARMHPIRGSDR